jgi:hypothetical protein
MTTAPETRPIPSGRYGAPVPAPNTPTECPRCGAPAISRNGVALHALDHRNRDLLEKRQEKLLDRLEAFLNGIEHLQTADGTPQRFPDWKQEIDDLVAELPETEGLARLEKLLAPETFEKLLALTTAEAPAPAPATAEPPRIIAWPEDEDVYASADPDDEPVAGSASRRTSASRRSPRRSSSGPARRTRSSTASRCPRRRSRTRTPCPTSPRSARGAPGEAPGPLLGLGRGAPGRRGLPRPPRRSTRPHRPGARGAPPGGRPLVTGLDRERLRDFLLGREDSPNAVVGAIYKGMRDRIDRGDFDEEETEEED